MKALRTVACVVALALMAWVIVAYVGWDAR